MYPSLDRCTPLIERLGRKTKRKLQRDELPPQHLEKFSGTCRERSEVLFGGGINLIAIAEGHDLYPSPRRRTVQKKS
jgi:hypothetical protein